MAQALISVTGAGLPQAGLKTYLFTPTGSYLGQYKLTGADGQILFTVPEGVYKFRTDYESNQFWSADSFLAYDIVNPVEITVGGGSFEFTLENLPRNLS